MESEKLLEKFKGKICKFIVKDSDGKVNVWFGKVLDVSSTHVLEIDRFNRLHLIKISEIVKVSEISELKG